jgi:hypothetical protein
MPDRRQTAHWSITRSRFGAAERRADELIAVQRATVSINNGARQRGQRSVSISPGIGR